MSSGNDLINGTSGDDSIDAGAGNDTINGSRGLDTIDGGDGIDLFSYNLSSAGSSVIASIYNVSSDLGESTLYNVEKLSITGGSASDILTGGEYSDTLRGGDGADYLDGGAGADSLVGGNGDDTLLSSGGADTLIGGADLDTAIVDLRYEDNGVGVDFGEAAGSMTIVGGPTLRQIDQVQFFGGYGNDQIKGTVNNDTIDAGYGDDTVIATGGYDYLEGNYGTDTLFYDGSADDGGVNTGYYYPGTLSTDVGYTYYSGFEQAHIIGSSSVDKLEGGEGYDTLVGNAGDDTLLAGLGGGIVDGGAGQDIGGADLTNVYDDLDIDFRNARTELVLADGTVMRSIEAVDVTAGYGSDRLIGTDNDDTIRGGGGSDTVIASGGYDYLYGGDGDDVLRFNGASETVQVWASVHYVYSSLGYSTAYEFERIDAVGGTGDDWLDGGTGADTIVAGDGNDWLFGNGGDDTLAAGAGDDLIYGGSGNDTVKAEGGDDYIDGGDEDDTLIYDAALSNYRIEIDESYPGQLKIVDTRAGSPDGTDTVFNVETFVFDGVSYTREELEGIAVPCFLPGTMILTPDGEKPVESLSIGDLVATADCTALPIKWIGRRCFKPPFSSLSPAIAPVLIRAGALGGGLPARDLMVSPCHAMLIDGVFVPARDLVDGIGVQQWFGLSDVSYLHIEFETPEAIYAEGALTESYVDHGNRAMYENAAEYAALYGASVAVAETRPRRFPLVSGKDELGRILARLSTRTPFRRAA